MIRYLKIIFVILVGLQGSFYFLSNAFNSENARSAVRYVLIQANDTAYSNSVIPTNSFATSVALIIIMAGELLVGLISFKGAFDMWGAREATPAEFHTSKRFAILGAGIAVIVSFGGFIEFNAAFSQMWQTALGNGSFNGAFTYMTTSALVMIFVNQRDD